MNAICYLRVSTREQAEGGVSLDHQEAKTRAYCEARDWTCLRVIRDEGQSAATLDRPGLEEALAIIRRGEAQALVVLKLDRLTRKVSDLGYLVEKVFDRYEVAFSSVRDNFDTSTANGRLVLNILGSVAQWERDIISERTADALAYKKSEGRRVGEVPYGYDLAADGDTLLPNEDELAIIRKVQDRREEGATLQGIADELTGREVPTKKGGRWWPATVRNLLTAGVPEEEAA